MAGKKGKTAHDTLRARDRDREAMDLRIKGHTYHQIADIMHVSVGTAHGCVVRSLNDTLEKRKELADQLRQIEADRLDRLLAKIDPAIEEGSQSAIALAVKLSESRRKLFGVDAPERVDVTTHEDDLDKLR